MTNEIENSVFQRCSASMRQALSAVASGGTLPAGFSTRSDGTGWSVACAGWREGRMEVAAAKVEERELTCVSRMLLERVGLPFSTGYIAGTKAPIKEHIFLLRDIESEPEGCGGGQTLFRVLAAIADSEGRWTALEAAPRGDLDRTLRTFADAGFHRVRPESDDCVFVRPPVAQGTV